MTITPAIIRPNGKTYRPRKGPRQIGFTDESGFNAYVAILGTHDIDAAKKIAYPFQCLYLTDPQLRWVKTVMRNGERYIATDADEHGAAAVVFRESDDPE